MRVSKYYVMITRGEGRLCMKVQIGSIHSGGRGHAENFVQTLEQRNYDSLAKIVILNTN